MEIKLKCALAVCLAWLSQAAGATTYVSISYSGTADGNYFGTSYRDTGSFSGAVGDNFTTGYETVNIQNSSASQGEGGSSPQAPANFSINYNLADIIANGGTLTTSDFSLSYYGTYKGSTYGVVFDQKSATITVSSTPVAQTNTSSINQYPTQAQSNVPETSTWAMMVLGFGMIGSVMRRRQLLKYI